MARKKQTIHKREIKKTIKGFIMDEEGFVTKETILRIGVFTIASIGMMSGMAGAQVHTNAYTPAQHTNVPGAATMTPVAGTTCTQLTYAHNDVILGGHTSHSSY